MSFLSLPFPGDLSVIPCKKNKQPAVPSWKASQSERKRYPLDAELYGIVCGKVSGNLECIDFDAKNIDSPNLVREAFEELIARTDPHLLQLLAIQRTPSGGSHYVYRVDGAAIANSTVLAKVQNKAIYETRGEAAYFCTGGEYRWVQNNLSSIPTITPEQQELLVSAAKLFGDLIAEPRPRYQSSLRTNRPTQSILDRFDEVEDALEILVRHGWSEVGHAGNVTYLRRPGKSDGVSATFNHPKCPGRVYVFTTSSALEAGRSYKPSQLVAFLEHDGDFKAAAKAIALQQQDAPSDTGRQQRLQENGNRSKLQMFESFVVANGLRFRHNTIKQRYEFSLDEDVWEAVTDRYVNTWANEIEDETKKRVEPALIRQYVVSARFAPDFDPLRDYFDSLPQWNEDIGDVIGDYCDLLPTNDPQITAEFLRTWLVATYLQAYKGGKINELFLVLVGKQGTGKTTWLRKLVPIGLNTYTYEGALRESKDTIQVLSGSWLAIDDELVGLSRKETEFIKQLISRSNFQYRPPYGHLDVSVERRVSFAGSTNEETFLFDGTGNRRFLPVGVLSKGDIPAMLDFNADRLWSQVKHLAETGSVKPLLSHEQETILETSRSSFEDLPTVVEIVTLYFEIAKTESDGTWMTSRMIVEEAYERHCRGSMRQLPPPLKRDLAAIGRWLAKNNAVQKSKRFPGGAVGKAWFVRAL